MSSLPHIGGSRVIPRVLASIRDEPPPPKVTPEYLSRRQFANPTAIISVLRAAGFITKAATPTRLWLDFQDQNKGPRAFADVLRQRYAVLFAAYPDADRRPDAALGKVLKIHTDFSNTEIQRTVATFRKFCASADFSLRTAALKTKPVPELREISIAELDAWVGHRPKLRTPTELLDLISAANLPGSRLLLDAIRCVDADLYPQAHVTAWNAFMKCALARLFGPEPRATWTPDRQVLDAMLDRGLCTTNEHEWLVPLLQRRHDCAHVTAFTPTRDQSLWYIDAIIEQIESVGRKPIA